MKSMFSCVLLVIAIVMASDRASAAIACSEDDLAAALVRVNVDFATEIQPILSVACANCHTNGGAAGGLDMGSGAAYANLVNVAASNPEAQMNRVTPVNPQASFLFKKINCTNLNGMAGTPYGLRMPRSGPPYLSVADQARILDWIREGALAVANPERIFASGQDGHGPPPN